MSKSFILFISVVLTTSLQAQLSKVTLRQSFQSKNEQAEPAFVTYSKPKDKQASWSINAAIGYTIEARTAVLLVNPYFEYHRNTLVEKEQNNWQGGVSVEWQLFSLADKNWSPILIFAEKYNKDEVKGVTSLQGNLYFTPLFHGRGGRWSYFWVPNIKVNFGNLFQFGYTPYVGVEHENRLRGPDELSEGSVYRLLLRITPTLTLLTNDPRLQGRVEVYTDFHYRHDFFSSVDNITSKNHRFFTASCGYTFISWDAGRRTAKVAIDYVNGENPTRGFEQQSYYAITLKVKL